MGADVIRVEQPEGDLMRALPVQLGERLSSAYVQYNNGKRSVGLNLKDERGRRLALELTDWADVVVENFAPGVLACLGLGWDVLHARDPRTILCSLSTFGASGPYAHLSGFGLVAEAYSGLMSLTGTADGPPMHFGTALADVNSAVHALAAIGAALHHRTGTGAGTHVDISAFDALFAMIDQQPAAGAFTNGAAVGGKYGDRHTTSVPSGVATCADGTHLAYGMSGDVFFARLAQAMDAPDLLESHGTVRSRVADPGPLYDRIEAWAATWPTADALVEHLRSHGLSAARVRQGGRGLPGTASVGRRGRRDRAARPGVRGAGRRDRRAGRRARTGARRGADRLRARQPRGLQHAQGRPFPGRTPPQRGRQAAEAPAARTVHRGDELSRRSAPSQGAAVAAPVRKRVIASSMSASLCAAVIRRDTTSDAMP